MLGARHDRHAGKSVIQRRSLLRHGRRISAACAPEGRSWVFAGFRLCVEYLPALAVAISAWRQRPDSLTLLAHVIAQIYSENLPVRAVAAAKTIIPPGLPWLFARQP
jgi:hypothetical protein